MQKKLILFILFIIILFTACTSEKKLSAIYDQYFLYTEEGDYKKAISLLEDEIPLLNRDFNYYFSVGSCYYQTNLLGDTRNANKSFFKAYRLDPTNFNNTFLLAKTFEQIQDISNAKKYFSIAIELLSTSDVKEEKIISDTYLEYAKLLVVERNFETALEYIEKSLDVTKNNPHAVLLKGFILANLDNVDFLELYYKKSLELSPTDPELKRNYGKMLIALGHYTEAYHFFLAIKNDTTLTKTDHFYAKIELAYLELLNGNYSEASLLLQNEDMLRNYGIQMKYSIFYYLKTNDYDRAYHEYNYYRAFQEDNEEKYAHLLFGQYNEKTDIHEILEYFKDDVFFQKLNEN